MYISLLTTMVNNVTIKMTDMVNLSLVGDEDHLLEFQ